jgi:hypothetical protein
MIYLFGVSRQRPQNKTTAVAMQQRGKYASATIDLQVETVFSL